MTWEEIQELLEKNKDKTYKELEKIFKKKKGWISRLKKFYEASEEEKEELAKNHSQFKAFYKLWKEYKEKLNSQEEIKEEEEKEEEQNKEISEELIKSLGLKLKECEKIKKELIKENAETALDINRKQNLISELQLKIELLEKINRYLKNSIYFTTILTILLLIFFGIKGIK